MKKLVPLMALLVGVVSSGAASAHAHLHSSMPANHSTVAEAPKQIALEFNEPVQLTAVSVQKGDGPATKLGPLADAPAKTFSLSLPTLETGNYIIKWRAVSDDGHVMADKVLFTVGAGK